MGGYPRRTIKWILKGEEQAAKMTEALDSTVRREVETLFQHSDPDPERAQALFHMKQEVWFHQERINSVSRDVVASKFGC